MANELITTVVDASTGEVIERAMTSKEVAGLELAIAEQEALLAERESKKVSRDSALAKLAALGFTEEEIAAL